MLTLLLSLSVAQGCPAGQTVGPETQGHCCWPMQVWSTGQRRCVGVPQCVPPMEPSGDECRSAAAPAPAMEVTPFPTSGSSGGIEPAPWPVQPVQPVEPDYLPPPLVSAPEPEQAPPPAEGQLNRAPPYVANPKLSPEPVPRPEVEAGPRRGAVNVSVLTSFDFSELTQGGTLGLEINFLRKRGGSLGLSLGVGLLGCAFTACSKLFLHFPLAFKGGFKLGSVVEWTFRVGAAPAFIWRRTSQAQTLVKVLLGTGLFFETGRGGVWVGFDFLPNSGLAHVLSLGYLF